MTQQQEEEERDKEEEERQGKECSLVFLLNCSSLSVVLLATGHQLLVVGKSYDVTTVTEGRSVPGSDAIVCCYP